MSVMIIFWIEIEYFTFKFKIRVLFKRCVSNTYLSILCLIKLHCFSNRCFRDEKKRGGGELFFNFISRGWMKTRSLVYQIYFKLFRCRDKQRTRWKKKKINLNVTCRIFFFSLSRKCTSYKIFFLKCVRLSRWIKKNFNQDFFRYLIEFLFLFFPLIKELEKGVFYKNNFVTMEVVV